MPDTPASRVEEARQELESYVRQMVDDDGALAIKEANGRGLTHFADAFAAAVQRETMAKVNQWVRDTFTESEGRSDYLAALAALTAMEDGK